MSTTKVSSHFVVGQKSKCPEILLNSWSQRLVDKTGVSHLDLVEPANALAQLHRSAGGGRNKATFLKYSADENYRVSNDAQMPESI